ncbi:MAG: glutamate racemase [Fluviibacter sp.]
MQERARVLTNPRPVIGVFDSGLGGLSVLGALADTCPAADLIYAADTAHVPYGNKTPEQIRARVLAMGQALVQQGCNTLVVACNTATAEAIDALRATHPNIPIVGVEPGIKPAAINTQSGQIAVLATAATAKSQRLAQLIARHAPDKVVHVIPCHGWATEVEALNLNAPAIIQEIECDLLPLIRQGVDQVVLGCTHYDFLAPTLSHLINGKAQLVGVAGAVARQACKVSGATGLNGKGHIRLLATANPERLTAAVSALGLDSLNKRIISASDVITTADFFEG